jgi:hypothetical protein
MAAATRQIELVPVDSLVPYEKNAKKHTEAQVSQLVRLIKEFGFTNPVLAEGDNLVAGHCRQKAVQQIYASNGKIKFPDGQELPFGLIPKIDCTGWSTKQKKAYIITDNKSAEVLGNWDNDILQEEVMALNLSDFDLELLCFSQEEIDKILDPEKINEQHEPAPEDFPEVDESIETEYRCPSCGYEWSGKAK